MSWKPFPANAKMTIEIKKGETEPTVTFEVEGKILHFDMDHRNNVVGYQLEDNHCFAEMCDERVRKDEKYGWFEGDPDRLRQRFSDDYYTGCQHNDCERYESCKKRKTVTIDSYYPKFVDAVSSLLEIASGFNRKVIATNIPQAFEFRKHWINKIKAFDEPDKDAFSDDYTKEFLMEAGLLKFDEEGNVK